MTAGFTEVRFEPTNTPQIHHKDMAQAIPTKASTLEGQLFEIANRIQAAESSDPTLNNIQVNLDRDGGTVSVTFSAPATFDVDDQGRLIATVNPYLP